jgi:GTP-binding protein LepA
MKNIRNFCIIAHIDHGKSTLADRFLELTETVEKRKMQEQYLDTMELERERGITIKLQPVRMKYKYIRAQSVIKDNAKITNPELENKGTEEEFIFNLIDTPGHVDFSYEVSRSLAAVEGAILLVDATKGIQAQTLANLYLAKLQNLKIIPAINKIDLANSKINQIKEELSYLLEMEMDEIYEVSGKFGTNVEKLLQAVIEKVPPPSPIDETKALIFDSTFDSYKGVIAYVRIFGGSFKKGDRAVAFATRAGFEVLDVGYFSPKLTSSSELSTGNIGYIATGLKNPNLIRVGDTITLNKNLENPDFKPLAGYKEPKPMVFASFFPENSEDYDLLKDALEKLKLTDASLTYEPESSAGLGRGFRLGFLGMLHVEIISERLKREFGLSLIISTPSVEYEVKLKTKEEKLKIRSASQLPDPSVIESISEPIVELEILTPNIYLGNVMELMSLYRNVYKSTDYLSKETILLKYDMPLSEIITDFYDKLKSVSSGYASMNYEIKGSEINDLVRLDILVAGEIVEPFSKIVPKEKAYHEGRAMVVKLKEIIPPQWFEVAIQAAVGGKIIARETIKARRKDVTGYLYGGDVTRKMKLLEKQKRGKKKMMEKGRVNLPQEVFLKMLRR